VGPQGAASVPASGRYPEKPDVHLPLGEPAGLALLAEAAVRGWSDAWPSNALALAQGLLCISLFTACGLHVRYRFKAVRAASAEIAP